MTMALVVAMACPVMAADNGVWTNQKEADGVTAYDPLTSSSGPYGGTFTYNTSGTGTSSGQVLVRATIDSSYTITVPAAITLYDDGTNGGDPTGNDDLFNGQGAIGCFGNITSDKNIRVSLTKNFNMENKIGSDVVGTVATTVGFLDEHETTATDLGVDATREVSGSNVAFSDFYFVKLPSTGLTTLQNGEREIGTEASPASKTFQASTAAMTKAGSYSGNISVQFGLIDRVAASNRT